MLANLASIIPCYFKNNVQFYALPQKIQKKILSIRINRRYYSNSTRLLKSISLYDNCVFSIIINWKVLCNI